jgi:ATP-dependent helicase HepA
MLADGEARAETPWRSCAPRPSPGMEHSLDAEIERLAALARVNPSVRDDEIGQLQLLRERLGQVLGRAHLRLDALRLVVHA